MDYPYAYSNTDSDPPFISEYATTSVGDAVYILGGDIGMESSLLDGTDVPSPIVAKFENDEWTRLENMIQARNRHFWFTDLLQSLDNPLSDEIWSKSNFKW